MDQIVIARHDAHAMRRFARAMRRHEKRAREQCGRDASVYISKIRHDVCSWYPDLGGYTGDNERVTAAFMRHVDATEAWLYERAADAVAKLRSALATDA